MISIIIFAIGSCIFSCKESKAGVNVNKFIEDVNRERFYKTRNISWKLETTGTKLLAGDYIALVGTNKYKGDVEDPPRKQSNSVIKTVNAIRDKVQSIEKENSETSKNAWDDDEDVSYKI